MPSTISYLNLNQASVSPTQPNVFQYRYPSGSVTYKNARIAIQSIIIPYSWLNVNQTQYNNTAIQLKMPVTIAAVSVQTTINITIPDGFYTIDALNQYLQSQMIAGGYYLVNSSGNNVFYLEIVANPQLNNAQLNVYPVPTALPSGYSYGTTATWGAAGIGSLPTTANQVPQLTTLANNFGSLIGFAQSTTFPSSTTSSVVVSTLSSTVPQITPVQNILIGCSLVRNIDASPTNIIATVPLTSAYATNIIYQPSEYIWMPILNGNVSSFQIIFYDQAFNQLPMVDTNVSIALITEREIA